MNCSQIFCTFAVETTKIAKKLQQWLLWIALKFFVLLQSKQQEAINIINSISCELLSNFLYFCSRNNHYCCKTIWQGVVNCSQIFCTFAVETTQRQHGTFAASCELLSNFLYFCSRNNDKISVPLRSAVVNCSQIFCTFAVETTYRFFEGCKSLLWIALKFFVLLQSKQHRTTTSSTIACCELLSNFLYFCSRNNITYWLTLCKVVVNCSQIFCTFAVETTMFRNNNRKIQLWIALKFFVLLQSKQLLISSEGIPECCELLSNFLYFCSRNNFLSSLTHFLFVVNCSQIFCTFAVETTSGV